MAERHRPAAARGGGRSKSLEDGLAGFWDAITAPGRAAPRCVVTVGVSVVVALINVVMGTLIAWVLVRDDFRGKRLVNALIDLPFALPTIVASIVLLSLYGPRSPIGMHLNATRPALVIALRSSRCRSSCARCSRC